MWKDHSPSDKQPAEGGTSSERQGSQEPWGLDEDRARIAFDNAPIGIAVVGLDYRLQKVNRALCVALGYSERELLARTFIDITHPDDVGRDVTLAGRLFRGEIPSYRLAKRFLTKDGRLVWLDLTALVVRGGDGEPLQGLAMVEDITERKRAEDALRQSEERYRSFVANSSEGIWRLEVERPVGTCLPADEQVEALYEYAYLAECNDAMARMHGYDRADDLIGMRLRDLLPTSGPENVGAVRALVSSGYRLHDVESVRQDENGQQRYFLNSVIGAVVNEMLLRVWGTQRDVTGRQRAKEQLEQAHREMRALAGHLQSTLEREMTHIARDIHDVLGQSLTALKIDLSWLSKKLPEAGDANNLPAMAERLDQAVSVLNETLATVRNLSAELRPGVLDKLGLAAAVEWQCREFERRTGVACEYLLPDEELPIGEEQATALFRILQEALTNVTRHARATKVVVELKTEGDYVYLVVRDDGRGGAGGEVKNPTSFGVLGMRERASLLGGDLTVAGEPGEGTVVTARLPCGDSGRGGGESP